MEYLKLAKLAAQTADDKLGKDILVLDVRNHSSSTDFFVFVGATSHLHVRALEDSIRESLKAAGAQLVRTDGQRGHLWRVLDYGGALIHIMDMKTREFYAVERLWDMAKRVPFSTNEPAAKPASKAKAKSKPKAKAKAKKATKSRKKSARSK